LLGALICRHICTCSSRSLLPSFRGIQLAIASMYRRHGAELAPINIRQQSTFLPFKHGHPSQRIANLTLALLCFGINYVPREESPPSTASLQNKQKKTGQYDDDGRIRSMASKCRHIHPLGPRFSPNCLSRSFRIRFTVFGYYTVSSTSRLRGICLAGAAPSCHVMSLAECLGAF
jgi:hypothetical protein